MTLTPSNLPSDLTQRVRDRLREVLNRQKGDENQLDMHEAIEFGFSIRQQESESWLSGFLKRLALMEDGSKSAAEARLTRSRKQLNSYSSGRIYQFAVLFEEALDVLGSEEAVIELLENPRLHWTDTNQSI